MTKTQNITKYFVLNPEKLNILNIHYKGIFYTIHVMFDEVTIMPICDNLKSVVTENEYDKSIKTIKIIKKRGV